MQRDEAAMVVAPFTAEISEREAIVASRELNGFGPFSKRRSWLSGKAGVGLFPTSCLRSLAGGLCGVGGAGLGD